MAPPERYRWSRYARFVAAPGGQIVAFSGRRALPLLLEPDAAATSDGAEPASATTPGPGCGPRGTPLPSPPAGRPVRPPEPGKIDPDGRQALLEAGLLVEVGHDELAALEDESSAERHQVAELFLNISPTLGCNLRCRYCFEDHKRSLAGASSRPRDPGRAGCPDPALDPGLAAGVAPPRAAIMTAEVADQLVRFAAGELARPGTRSFAIHWFGGEPLLAAALVEELTTKLRGEAENHGVAFEAHMFTNGYLLTPEVSRRLAEAGLGSVVIAVDGRPETHDARRPRTGGGATFDTIWANLGPASEHLEVIVQTMVDQGNQNRAWDIRDLLSESALGDRVKFRIARVRQGADPRRELSPREFGRLQLDGLARYGVENAIRIGVGLPKRSFGCSYRRERSFAIAPNGAIHRCPRVLDRPEWAVGHVSTGLNQGSATASRWRRASPFTNPTCRRCPVLPLCGGGCALELGRGRLVCSPYRWLLDEWLTTLVATQEA